MSLTPPPLPVLWFCRAAGDFRRFTVQWQEWFCTVTPSPELSTLRSMSLTRTVQLQNLVAYLVAEGTPLRHVLLGSWKEERASRSLGGSRGRGGGEHSNAMHLFTSVFLPGIPTWWGWLFHFGTFHFHTWLQGPPSPQKSPAKGAKGAQSAPASDRQWH